MNDESKDKTKSIGQQYEKRYPDSIYLINKENGGHGSALNKGIELATGKYFKVVDGDEWVDTKEFIKFVKTLENVESDVVATPYVRVNDIQRSWKSRHFLILNLVKYIRQMIY